MKRIIFIALSVLVSITMGAQTAKSVLDKAAAVVSNKSGVKASFSVKSGQYGSTSGTIAVKGKKFTATTPYATTWFDGKTQWTYMKKNNEVNISNPTEAELQSLNPYNFINMYRSGYKYTMTTQSNQYTVHLTATNKRRQVSQMYIVVDKSSYRPTKVSMLQGKKWTTITISSFSKSTLSDSMFKFNAKDCPKAEIIDLR